MLRKKPVELSDTILACLSLCCSYSVHLVVYFYSYSNILDFPSCALCSLAFFQHLLVDQSTEMFHPVRCYFMQSAFYYFIACIFSDNYRERDAALTRIQLKVSHCNLEAVADENKI